MHQIQSSSDIKQLQQQLQSQRILIETKPREVHEHQALNTELQSIFEEHQHTIIAKTEELLDNQRTLASNDCALETCRRQKQMCEMEFQCSLQQKDEAIQQKESEQRSVCEQLQSQLQEKGRVIFNLQETLKEKERKITRKEHKSKSPRKIGPSTYGSKPGPADGVKIGQCQKCHAQKQDEQFDGKILWVYRVTHYLCTS